MPLPSVLICGTDDHATACALRLFRAGYQPILLSPDSPPDLHHHRTFTRAVHLGSKTINAVRARTWSSAIESELLPLNSKLDDFIRYATLNNEIPIVLVKELKRGFYFPVNFALLFDEQTNQIARTHIEENVVRIALQDLTSEDAQYRIATHPFYLGRVIYPFNQDEFVASTYPDQKKRTIISADREGVFQTSKDIGQAVFKGDVIGTVDDLSLKSPLDGIISGQLNSGLFVKPGVALIEISDKSQAPNVRILPVESFAIAGGVLEAVSYHWHQIHKIS